MSIPKEPRQLMINIMYLVLTAMLALNVSAEVMNAFFTLDKGNMDTMAIVDEQLNSSEAALKELLSDESKQKFRPIEPAIQQVRAKSAEFMTYVNELRDLMIDASGNNNGSVDEGDYKEDHGNTVIKGKKNKDVTTRLLVDEGRGEELKEKIKSTRQELIDIYSRLLEENKQVFGLNDAQVAAKEQSIGANMAFNVNEDIWKGTDKESWADFKFRQMPLAAVLPLMSQIQADLKTSEANMVNDMISLAGGKTITFDKFFPVVQADRSYVVGGEQIKAKISVGTYSSTLDPANVRISVNGSPQRINPDGTADYNITGSGTGSKTVPLSVAVTNPLTGEVTEGKGEFTYEVGSRSVAVSADKMNVFYIGVDNPMTVSAAGVSSNDVRVNVAGAASSKVNNSSYVIKPTTPGNATVTVTANGTTLGSFPFRVKRIPDPQARLSGKVGGTIGSGEFKAQGGVGAFLDDFDFDATCQVAGFEIVYVAKRQDAVPNNNGGARYDGTSRELVNRAKPGDTYYFNNVRAKCPGDNSTRQINSMVFTIR